MESVDILCQGCEDDDAAHFCEDCKENHSYYCTECAERHVQKKEFAKHRMKVIGEESVADLVPFAEFISHLGCFDRFSSAEKRFVNSDALVIHNTDGYHNDTLDTFQPKELLLMILQKIMACDHHCRKVCLRKQTAHAPYPIIHHPMDTLLALLLCCDDIFLQDLFNRLYTCQLAIPLLLPNPRTKKITFPLWAMREIVKQWKYCDAAGKCIPCEGRLVDCEAPIVSFMRFNKAKNLYKSKILNGVISDSKHQYFFDYECDGSDAKRHYVDGLAEISWYLPNGKSDLYPTPVAFCNLRGDARNHSTQFKILTTISQVCFLFVRNDDVNELLREMLSFKQRKSKVYLLMNVCSHMDIIKKIPNSCVLLLKKKNPPAVVENIRLKIYESLNIKQSNALSICLNPRNFEPNGVSFEIDEISDSVFNYAGKKLADKIMQYVHHETVENKNMLVKQAIVPFQGQTLWQEWAKENKKQKRLNPRDMGNTCIHDYDRQQKELKESIAQKMLSKGIQSNAVEEFVNGLVCHSPQEERIRLYFLHWLKLKLDDYSRKTLPKLRAKCETTRALLAKLDEDRKAKHQKNQEGEKNKLHKRLYLESQELINASFGQEHFFREFGVIYEMVSEMKSSQITAKSPLCWSDVKQFPKIAAELLLGGQPLELLDGDAAHIAINWITAILEELKKLIGENSKLFVLSVLGIQGSGKSTLFNTAFGLRFAVSAGRCTRGAFFQLLKCDDTFQGKCDYLLVIDTEGLRAPELAYEGTQKHDNELATLVIGLAGLTIINVSGEVSGEMDDILQTSVHAFLRMKEAELRPSCLLVKHHVDDVTANKGMDGLYNVQDKLDEMTVLAAHEEHCEGLYKKFSDVIQFNVEKDVHYFPNLWTGNPPMSPVNPQYSEAAQKLKMEVIRRMSASQTDDERYVVCSLDEFRTRVKTLWEAVLRENFIFSFKNTPEIAAFNDLDQHSGNWSWDLEIVVKNWEDKTRRAVKAGKLESEEHVSRAIKEIEYKLDIEHRMIEQKIKELFEKHKSASVLAQWRGKTEREFITIVQEHKRKSHKYCNDILEQEKLMKKVSNRVAHEEKIQREVKNLVEEMNVDKDTEVTESMKADLHGKFSAKWEEWMKEIETDAFPLQSGNIEKEIMDQILTQRCGIENLCSTIKKSVQSNPLLSKARTDHLFMTVEKGKHINAYDDHNQSFGSKAITFLKSKFVNLQQVRDETHSMINEKTSEILQSQKKYLNDFFETERDYNVREILVIVQSIERDIEHLKNEVNEVFSFTAEYHVDVILTVCGYALKVFEKMRERSNANHPVTYFKSLEEVYRNDFILHCTQGVEEKATALRNTSNAASNLSILVMSSVKWEFNVQLKNALQNKLRHANILFKYKKALKREVLLRLLKERSFSLYKTYLTDVSESYLYWIERFVDEECSSLSNGKSLVTIVAEEELQSIKTNVEKVVNENPVYSSIEKWLETFHERTDMSVNKADLMRHVGQHSLERLDFFKSEFLKKFDSDMEKFTSMILHNNAARFNECKNELRDFFFEKTAGCCAQCPFCKEQCEATNLGHDGPHICDIHRPQCLGGYRCTETGEMILSLCNDDIRGNGTFKCKKTDWKPVRNRDYRKYFPEWLINTSPTSVPCYWQWFVGNFTKEIANQFSMKEPVEEERIVSSWKRLPLLDAEKDVEDKYKNSC